jgi:hypothetical protein
MTARRLPLWRLAIVALALALAWRVIHVNAVLYDDDGRPRLPVPESGALPTGAAERDQVASVLRESPAQAAALLVLARDHEQNANPEAARRAYLAAYQLAPVDREVLAAAAGFFLRQGKAAEALALLDRMAENFPETREQAFPVFAALLASPAHAAAWNAVAARGPAWLGPFMLSTCARGVDPSLLLPLFFKRVAAGAATPAQTGCLVDRLRRAGRWDEAYQVWLNTLPRERLADVGFVYNGSFEYAPSGIGFDWMPARQPEREVGHSVDVAQTSGAVGKRALRVSYNGKRQSGAAIAQYLALPPGRYEMSGFGRPNGMSAGRGVHWTVRCVADGKPQAPLADSERFVGSSEWRRFVFDVTVPESCRAQVLQLEAVGIDEGPAYVSGTAWFDDLLLRRRG